MLRDWNKSHHRAAKDRVYDSLSIFCKKMIVNLPDEQEQSHVLVSVTEFDVLGDRDAIL